LLQSFNKNHTVDLQQLELLLVDKKYDRIRSIAHNIKGASGTLGLTSLQQQTHNLEKTLLDHHDALSTDEETNCLQLISNILSEHQSFIDALLLIKKDRSNNTASIDSDIKKINKLLQELEKLLATDDSKANALFMENEEILLQAYGATAEQIGQHIELFDYPQALSIVKTLLKNGS